MKKPSDKSVKLIELIRDHTTIGSDYPDESNMVGAIDPDQLLDIIRDFIIGEEDSVVITDQHDAERVLRYAETGIETVIESGGIDDAVADDIQKVKETVTKLYKQIPWVEEKPVTQK